MVKTSHVTWILASDWSKHEYESLIGLYFQPQIQRDMKHDLSPEIASKSLNALKDRKVRILASLLATDWPPLLAPDWCSDVQEEILTELGDIVGETNAEIIGDIAKKQAVVEESRWI